MIEIFSRNSEILIGIKALERTFILKLVNWLAQMNEENKIEIGIQKF